MFDDEGDWDEIVRWYLALVAGFVVVSVIGIGLATWRLSRWARSRGRSGGRIAAFVVAVGAEVFVLASLSVRQNAYRVDATGATWLLVSGIAVSVAGVRLWHRRPDAVEPPT